MLKYRRRLMRGNAETIAVIICTVIVVMMSWIFIAAIKLTVQSYNCDNYNNLTGTKTAVIEGKCYKYVDGQLQIVKELE